ncbi:hypothetical protein NQZ71_13105 [Niallia taxi]|uniref:hypothetical protein n=1 Tax=Niallia taxi TaxID=2499688 RepID=UPI0029350D4E|nr:hypothetical protein [Niallia taxi]WOD61753.1 hypothetical protein NQZ71_13105 [Niallia taxi]
MDFVQITTDIASSQFVWTILFILLGGYVIREMYKQNTSREERIFSMHDESKAEAKVREDKLMRHLERSNKAQEETAKTLVTIQDHMINIDERVGNLEKASKKAN